MRIACNVLSICLIVLAFVCSGCKPSSTAQLEENKVIARRSIEQINKRDWATFMELHAPDLVYHGPGTPKPLRREEMVQLLRMNYETAFPDGRVTIEDMIAEADKVVIRMTLKGTHKGDYQGIPATGKEVTHTAIVILRIAGGKIVEAWEECDELSFMQQLGAIPPIGETGKK